MMKVMINDTIETFWESLLIKRDGCNSYDAMDLETTIHCKSENLLKLMCGNEVTCKCDNGMVFEGIIKDCSVKKGVDDKIDVTIRLYRL
jgi:hypothetical protein